MKSLKESVMNALDCDNIELYPFLPYILQDLWELGTSPEIVIQLVEKHARMHPGFKILDLACGKGAVSIRTAQRFNRPCLGIDAIEAFIDTAKSKAMENGVAHLCSFRVGDIREEVRVLSGSDYDVIILGSTGPVLGNYFQTLTSLKKCLVPGGVIIIDDGFIESGKDFSHPQVESRETVLEQISQAEMEIAGEVVISPDEIRKSESFMMERIKKRCRELGNKHPLKKHLFEDYIKKQYQEFNTLGNRIICSTVALVPQAS